MNKTENKALYNLVLTKEILIDIRWLKEHGINLQPFIRSFLIDKIDELKSSSIVQGK
jgi:hypothetical protein